MTEQEHSWIKKYTASINKKSILNNILNAVIVVMLGFLVATISSMKADHDTTKSNKADIVTLKSTIKETQQQLNYQNIQIIIMKTNYDDLKTNYNDLKDDMKETKRMLTSILEKLNNKSW